MRTTSIITVFLTCNNRYLILKRSDKVRTMRNLWGGISGTIEGKEEPIHRAKKEVSEEAGIQERDISLLKAAEPMRVESQYYNHEWLIYPFLFSVRDQAITLNWENKDYAWINPDDLGKYRTVPSLDRVLACLL